MIPRDNPIPALQDFILAWVPDLLPEHRVAPSEIPAFVPGPLRAIYELAGNWPVPYTEQCRAPNWTPGLFATQDMLLPVDQLAVNGDRFTFIRENQCVWSCETLVNGTDPPVFSDASSADGSDEGMREVCPSLSHFLTTFCLHELVFGSGNLFCVDSEPQNPTELVESELQPLWPNGVYAYKGATYSFYLCDGDLMIMQTGWGPPSEYWLAYNKDEGSKLLSPKHDIRQIH